MPRAAWVPAGVEDRELSLDGLRVRYLHAGSGPPLLLIHGLLGYSFSWRYNLLPLAENFSVFAPDLPGTGFSERPPRLDCGMSASVSRLERLLDAQHVDRFHLLGTSHGGALAVFLAAKLRARVLRLVLSAPANPWSRHGRHLIPLFATRIGHTILSGFTASSAINAWGLRRMYGDRKRISPGTVEGYAEHIRLPGTAAYVQSVFRGWRDDMRRYEAALHQISGLSTLILWGGLDRAVFPDSAPELHRRLPHSRLVTLPGVGHLPYEEVPGEFNRLVTGFLVEDSTV